jgi:hypothetical protein
VGKKARMKPMEWDLLILSLTLTVEEFERLAADPILEIVREVVVGKLLPEGEKTPLGVD